MQDYKDFTYASADASGNPMNFNRLPTVVNRLHNLNMKFVPIIDAGVSYRPGSNYKAFNDGMNQDVFLKQNGQVFVGKVWPNEAAFPDFTHPNTQGWWEAQLDNFHSQLAFDGLWQDMNEASNFCNGACVKAQRSLSPIAAKLRYTPTGEDIETKSISMDAKHHNNYTELDAHSFFGTSQVAASNNWFAKNNKRTMVISRSSFAGHGKFGSMWLGDNHASVDDMEISVL
jgi:alpha-glucosidase (family GH31 glycosyl hydrolase)